MRWKKYFLVVLLTASLIISNSFGIDFLQNNIVGTTAVAQTGNAINLLNEGTISYGLGDYHRAIRLFKEFLDISRQINNPELKTDALNRLGNAYRHLRKYQKAINYYNQSLAINQNINYPRGKADALMGLASVYHRQTKYQKSIDYNLQAFNIYQKIGFKHGEADCSTHLGDAYQRLGKYDKAIYYHNNSLKNFTAINDNDGEALALTGLGNAFFGAGKLGKAEEALRSAIKIREDIRQNVKRDKWKVSIFDRQALTYYLLQQVLVKQNKPQEALLIAERGRNRALVEILFQRLSQNRGEQLTPPTLEDIQRIAREQNATLVEYSVIFDNQLYIWVIPPQGEIQFQKKILPKSLKELVKFSRDSIGVRGRGSNNSTTKQDNPSNRLKQLHQLFIEPIAEFLPKDEQQRVIFIPHRESFLVPFVALQDEENEYLIEKHTILTAPSIQALDLTQQNKQVQKNSSASVFPSNQNLIVGNPTMPKSGVGKELKPLQQLPGAEQEAKKIAVMLGTQAIIGDEATESAIVEKMASAKLIHFATHGLLDSTNADGNADGFPGAIALAPDPPSSLTKEKRKSNGFLTTSEIMESFGLPGKSRLQADLVVLSACDTGRGDIRAEGIIGLSRAFMASGVPSLVVSLWKVPDEQTVKLMSEFYTNIYQGKLDKATAMRKAMLTMIDDDDPDPKNWAAFTVIGKAE